MTELLLYFFSLVLPCTRDQKINPPDDDYDYDQVSDDGSVEIQAREVKKKDEGFFNVADYFHPPFFKDNEAEREESP